MLVELGIVAAFLAMLCWGVGDFLIQRSVRKIGNLESLALIGLIGAVGLTPFIIGEIPKLFSLQNILLLVLLGIITFVAGLFDFEALKEGKISVIDIILELELPMTIVLGMIFFNEYLTAQQYLLIAPLFFGIVLMAFKSNTIEGIFKKVEKGVFIAVLAAIGLGAINFLTAASSKQISPLMAVWFPWLLIALMSLFAIWRREGLVKLAKNSWNFKWLVLFMGIFDTLAWLFYASATYSNDIGVVTAITESYPIIAIALGIFYNREKIHGHQYVGAGIALVSSILLSTTI